MKPQTLLVDFDPNRMFVMQERKSKIYNANVETGGNSELGKRIEEELEISPIITLNKDKIVRVKATDILDAVSNYRKDKGIKDEALEIPVDLSILDNDIVRAVIEKENEIGSKSGLTVTAHEDDDENENAGDIDIPESSKDGDETNVTPNTDPISNEDKKKTEQSLSKKIQSYYTRILLFAFITKDTVISLDDVIAKSATEDNARIIKNLGLNVEVLTLLNKGTNKFVLSDLDYKIQNLNKLSKDDTLSPEEKASVAISKFGKLGEAIVVTPSNICDDMVALFPDEMFTSLPTTNGKVLDIAGTAGEYAVAIYKRMSALGVEAGVIKNSIYTIPKSAVCYELIRKLYDMLGLNIANIAKEFIATDLLEVKKDGDIDYDKIKALLTQNKPFETIKLTDSLTGGQTDMIKFEAVVGNPPYQTVNKGDGNGANPIYHLFIDMGSHFSDIFTFIHPSRFLFNAGKTPKEWNKKMLTNNHFNVVEYWANGTEVFPNVDVKGGIAVTFYDKKTKHEPIGFFSAYNELRTIVKKVTNFDFTSFSAIIYPRDLYHLTEAFYQENPEMENRQSKGHRYDCGSSVFEIFPELFFKEKPNDGNEYAKLYGRVNSGREYRWVKRKYLKTPDNFDFYKIFIPKSNGSGAIGEVLSTPVVGQPVVGHTVTFLSIGKFCLEEEAEAVLKYIKTKFARCLLGSLKVTQDNPRETWQNVPMQDFTDKSDIDWSKSVIEIDQQLYKKYNLNDSEIAFIESMIKPME